MLLRDGASACAGLLTSGVVPAMRHCLQSLLTDDAVLIPASATVFVQVCTAHIMCCMAERLSRMSAKSLHVAVPHSLMQT